MSQHTHTHNESPAMFRANKMRSVGDFFNELSNPNLIEQPASELENTRDPAKIKLADEMRANQNLLRNFNDNLNDIMNDSMKQFTATLKNIDDVAMNKASDEIIKSNGLDNDPDATNLVNSLVGEMVEKMRSGNVTNMFDIFDIATSVANDNAKIDPKARMNIKEDKTISGFPATTAAAQPPSQ